MGLVKPLVSGNAPSSHGVLGNMIYMALAEVQSHHNSRRCEFCNFQRPEIAWSKGEAGAAEVERWCSDPFEPPRVHGKATLRGLWSLGLGAESTRCSERLPRAVLMAGPRVRCEAYLPLGSRMKRAAVDTLLALQPRVDPNAYQEPFAWLGEAFVTGRSGH